MAGILKDYLWRAAKDLGPAAVVENVLKAFVSPEKRKSQVTVDDLWAELDRKRLEMTRASLNSICQALTTSRLVRAVDIAGITYLELSHDLLASAIGERVTEEEVASKFARRMVRSAEQDFSATNALPGHHEYQRLSDAAAKAALTPEDHRFLSLCAANLNRPVDALLDQAISGGLSETSFFQMCITSRSLLAMHEVLRRVQYLRADKCKEELASIGRSERPSLQLHFANFVRELRDGTTKEALSLLVHLPTTESTIPEGWFTFGMVTRGNLSVPESRVWIDEFAIDRFPVTNAEYLSFIENTGHRHPWHWIDGRIPYGKEYHPVIYVSWYDAASYASWKHKRLPTEAEWEKAGYWDPVGLNKRLYPWGDEFDPLRANFIDSGIVSTSPIGQFSEQGDSAYNLTDMAGNVYEWLLDDAKDPFTGFQSDRNPVQVVGVGTLIKMTRGGSYGGPEEQLRCGYRGYSRIPAQTDAYVGFRCVSSTNQELEGLMLEQLSKRRDLL